MAILRRWTQFLAVGVCAIFLTSAAYWKYSRSHREIVEHKKQSEGPEIVLNNNEATRKAGSEEFPPGQLICQRIKKNRIAPDELTGGLDDQTNIRNDELVNSRKNDPIRISLSSQNPYRPIGCCPVGDPNGKMYRGGFGCCGDEIYNEQSHFCCRSKLRVFATTTTNQRYCDPPNGIPVCREIDLNMRSKSLMTKQCEYNELHTPVTCRFACPNGTVLKNDVTQAECLEIGEWDRLPTCCEGCPNTHHLDLWFLIEMSQDYGEENFKLFMQFLKDALSYMPVSQNGVRVGITMFNRVVFFDVGVWYMNDHDSHEAIDNAIDEIPVEGNGVNAGRALDWVAENSFTESKGDRKDVGNLAIVIINGKPEDSIIEPARKLKEVSRVMAIAIGNKTSDGDLGVIASSADDVYRSESFERLKDLNKLIYKSACGENCRDEMNR